MDKLRITGLEISALIGVRAWERNVRQRLMIDLELDTDASRAGTTDALADALDYGTVARRVVELTAGAECRLIETLAERIARGLLDEFAVERVKVIVHKPAAVQGARDTSIEIERAR